MHKKRLKKHLAALFPFDFSHVCIAEAARAISAF